MNTVQFWLARLGLDTALHQQADQIAAERGHPQAEKYLNALLSSDSKLRLPW